MKAPLRTSRLSAMHFDAKTGLCLVLWFFCSIGLAKQDYTPQYADPLAESGTWERLEGLPNKRIYSLEVTPEGTIWIALIGGSVIHYDGTVVREFGEKEGLSGAIRFVKVNQSKQVYAITDNSIFKLERDRWRLIDNGFGRLGSSHAITRKDGSIWFAAENRLVRIINDEVSVFVTDGEKLHDLLFDNRGYIWTTDGASGTIRRLQFDGANRLKIIDQWPNLMQSGQSYYLTRTSQIKQTRDGRIWAINDFADVKPKVFDYDSGQWRDVKLPSSDGTHRNFSILQTSDDRLLITGDSYLYVQAGKQSQSYNNQDLDLARNFTSLHESNDGYLWLMEQKVGISRIDYLGNKSKIFNDLLFQCDLAGGARYFLNQKGHVVVHDSSTVKGASDWYRYTQSDGIIAEPVVLLCSKENDIWVAGSHNDSAAISYFDGKSWQRTIYPELGKTISFLSALQTGNGDIYFGSNDIFPPRRGSYTGLIKFSKRGQDYEHQIIPVHSNRAVGIVALPDQRLVTGGTILKIIRDRQWKPMNMPSRTRTSWTDDIAVDQQGKLWLALWGDGVYRYSHRKWTRFSREQGLSSENISNLLVRSDGSIIAAGDEGIDIFDGAGWRTLTIPGYLSKREGMTLAESGDGGLWINVASRNWFFRSHGTPKHYGPFRSIRFQPESSNPDTQVKLLEPIKKYQRAVYVSWSGRDHWSETPVNQLQYSFRLNDDGWSDFSYETRHFFSGLDAGDYLLEVRARDSSGNIDPSPAGLKFEIIKPFWQSNIFYALLASLPLIIAGLILSLLLQRMRHVAKLDRARLRFLTNISHELRSPLSLIQGPLEKLTAKSIGDDDTKSDIKIALRNTHRLNKLVGQLLDYRKLQTGSLVLQPKVADFIAFMKMVVSDFENLASMRDQKIELIYKVEKYFTQFDADALRKIIDNLILNALKYSADGRHVKIRLKRPKKKAGFIIEIEDEGIGISRETMSHIFEPFYTGRHKPKADMKSFGIGMALTKELVDLCGGSITVTSPTKVLDGKAVGALFRVEFPLMTEVEESKVAQNSGEIFADISSATKSKFNIDLNPEDTVVLVVDDHRDLGDYVAKELKQEFRVIVARSGEEGFEIAKNTIPDIIVSDVVMPGMDGLELCEALKKHTETNHIPIILYTSLASFESELKGFNAGVVDYLSKPVSIPLLKSRIRNHLASCRRFADFVNKRVLGSDADAGLSDSENPELKDDAFINTLKKILHENYHDSFFNAEVFAEKMKMSVATFYRKFKAITNEAPAEAIKNFRLDKAKQLLKEGEQIATIAEKVGYSDPSPFTRAFKKRFNIAPGEYKNHVNNSEGN